MTHVTRISRGLLGLDLSASSRASLMRLCPRKKEGQEACERRKGNKCVQPRVCLAGRVMRHRGEAETPTSNQSPRGAQGRRLLGPAALRTCPFASLLSQVRARLGPGGYCRCSGNGGPHTCLPAAYGVAQVGGPVRPSFISSSSRPSRGAKPRGVDDRKLPQRQPHQAGSRGGGEINAGVPREESMTQAMTIKARRAPACIVSLFPL